MNKIINKILDYLYARTFLSCILYRYTIAYKTLFPNNAYIDPETLYKDEIKLILFAIREPSFNLSDSDMGIVLSLLINRNIPIPKAWEICGIINSEYKDWEYFKFSYEVAREGLKGMREAIAGTY
jgi:hypothetical protein